MRVFFKKALKIAIFAYLLICLFMWIFQRLLIYAPSVNIQSPKTYGLNDFAELTLVSEDDAHISAWHHTPDAGYPTLIFFHGKGGNLGDRSLYFRSLSEAGFGILAIDYRGYGASTGSPSEKGLYQDARAAMDYAVKTVSLAPHEIILYGESIGTGVAMQIASEYPEGAVILQSPFTSLQAIAEKRYPWLPVAFLLKDRFDSLGKVTAINAPLLLIHGAQDRIVPIGEGQALFARALEPKEAVYYPDKGHNDLDIKARTDAILTFCRKHKLIHDK